MNSSLEKSKHCGTMLLLEWGGEKKVGMNLVS